MDADVLVAIGQQINQLDPDVQQALATVRRLLLLAG